MTSPFDDEAGMFVVLINDELQYSLWPAMLDVPAGWAITFGPAERERCVEQVDANWTDMRPRGLASSDPASARKAS